MNSFVPRPIYRVKPYGYVVEKGDTASQIATKFRRPEGDYRELVAANLENRRLMPMPLGSPFGARTFAGLEEGETLKIPAHWPDPPASVLGDAAGGSPVQIPDAILSGMTSALQTAAAAGGVDPSLIQSASNAAVSWWMNTQGTAPATSPTAYIPYVTSAIAWAEAYVPQILQKTSPEAAAGFPWGPLLAMLPAPADPASTDWQNGTIPGTSVPWSSLPWGYLASLGPALEKISVPPIPWPTTDVSPASVLAVIQSVLGPAIAALQTAGCGAHAHLESGQCFCDAGYVWAKGFDPNDPASMDCVEAPFGPPSPPAGGAGGDVIVGPGVTPTTTTTPPDTGRSLATPADTGMPSWKIGLAVVGGVALVAGTTALVMLGGKKRAS